MLHADFENRPFTDGAQVRYFSLARHALFEALTLAGVRAGSRVLLPSYLCRDMLAPLWLLDAKPVWYDVAPDMRPSQAQATWPEADVVLAVNYFGFPQDLGEFANYASRTSALVIEDNAHGFLSRSGDGRWLGCRADLGLFSMRKTMRIPDGAALWMSPQRFTSDLPGQLEFNGEGLNPAQLTKARIRSVPLVGEQAFRLSTQLIRQVRRVQTGSETPAPDPDSEMSVPGAATPWKGLLKSLAEVEPAFEIERRRNAYLRCAEAGRRLGAMPVFSELPSHCAPYAFAFRGDDAAVRAMRNHAQTEGFDFVRWPDLPGEIAEDSPPYYSNVFLVNFLW